MKTELFNELVEALTANVEQRDVVRCLDDALYYVVGVTGEAGEQALKEWCAARAEECKRDAG